MYIVSPHAWSVCACMREGVCVSVVALECACACMRERDWGEGGITVTLADFGRVSTFSPLQGVLIGIYLVILKLSAHVHTPCMLLLWISK